jgi:1-acyl-sn-glycerol-3-phosphate acyltransferase
MALLYRGLRKILQLGLELYFVDIQRAGEKRIPRTGPVIFAANHPNSIMDTVVLGSQTNRTISYLARSGLFENPLVALLFRNAGVIPIYRRGDGPAPEGGNDESFRAAFEVLENGGTIGIFPEGQNAPERHVRDIKTGTARIALGAEAKNDWSLGVNVIPVGLNFEDRDRYLTRVLVRFGEPIDVREFAGLYREDERRAVRELTERIQDGIRTEAVHVVNTAHEALVDDVADLYTATILEEVMGRMPDVRGQRRKFLDSLKGIQKPKEDLDDLMVAKQHIADAIVYFEEHNPKAVERLSRSIRRHKDHLNQVSLRRDFFERPPKTLSARREAAKMTLYAVLLAPFAFYGLAHNFVPQRLTRRLVLRAPDEAMRAITAITLGSVVYGIFYAVYGWLVLAGSGSWLWASVYLVTLPFAGMWWIRYRRQLARYSGRIVARALFASDRRLVRKLLIEREQILMEIDELRLRYQGRAGTERAATVSTPPS